MYEPEEKTFPVPLEYTEVVRQTRTDIDGVSESTINDIWTEDKDVSLSGEWIGTTRLQILCTRLLEGYKWVEGRPTKIEKSTPPADSIWLEA